MLKTAVIGGSGYIGSHLLNKYREEFPDCIGTTFSKKIPHLKSFDITKGRVEKLGLIESGHQSVVIASAKPNISFCENEPDTSYNINVDGTLELIKKLEEMSLKVIFLSSDYVFGGEKGNFIDEHLTKPSTNYGKHKEIVEKRVSPSVTIVRLSKVYGLIRGDKTLLDEGAELLSQNKQIMAAKDQFFCPTYVEDVVKGIISIQEKAITGKINLCGSEKWSRFEIFNLLAERMGKDKGLIKAINLYDIPEMIGRPLDTSMVCNRFGLEIGEKFILLEDAIEKVANNYV